MKVKKPLLTKQQSNVGIWSSICDCGLVYIGETKHTLEIWLKEHKDATQLSYTNTSALLEHAWVEQYENLG